MAYDASAHAERTQEKLPWKIRMPKYKTDGSFNAFSESYFHPQVRETLADLKCRSKTSDAPSLKTTIRKDNLTLTTK